TLGTVIEVDLTVTPPATVGAATSSNEAVVTPISGQGQNTPTSRTVFRADAAGTANLFAMINAACAPNAGCGAAAGFSYLLTVVPR
ncbi:MAG TPA: hypothetical protein VII50_01655, partial [Acidothermaceae bacterium]